MLAYAATLLSLYSGQNLRRPAMWKKQQERSTSDKCKLWIAPKRAQEENGLPSHSRYLELADIALGLTKPKPWNKKPVVSAHDFAWKREPYKKP